MAASKRETSRCVLLTDSGLQRFHDARRKYRKTIENIAWDKSTPSVNTVKRAFKQGPVFVDTLERIWDYLRTCAETQKDELPDLVRGVDYVFETETSAAPTETQNPPEVVVVSALPSTVDSRRGWLSRQVPRPNRLFLGRRDILDRLHNALKSGPAALIPDPQALTGLGGIGKTQTAIAYVYEHRMDYDGILWIASETVEDLNEGLAGLAQELKLLDSPTASRQEALEKIHDWFQTRSGWLLVLDNADDLHALAPHFPRHHTGSLLLTTRGRNTTLWAAPVEIVKFDRAEGALLLLRRAGLLALRQTLDDIEPAVRQIAENLSDELDGLPLALDQAGAYLAETQLPIFEYASLYRTSGVELLDRYPDPLHQPVRITYQLAVHQVTRRGKYGEAAVEMLRLCAFLAPDSIPESIFQEYAFPQEGRNAPAKDPAYYGEICAIIGGYSLIRRDPSVGTISLHRLVQRVIRETLSENAQREWCERTVQAVADASPDFEFEDWSLCDQFLPHWRLCAEYIQTDRIETQAAAYLLHQLGRYVRARALYTEAEAFLRQSLEISQNIFGEVNRTTANYMDTLACLYRDLDRIKEAEALHIRSIEISSAVVGADHPETAVKLHNLALLYSEQQEYKKAEDSFVRALKIRERELSSDHPGVATTLTQLGGVYRGQERFEEAADCYRRALDIYERTLEPNHVDLATGYNNLALLYITTQRAAEAEPLYLRALRINETSRGPNHPETGTVLWGLAIAQWRQGRHEDADGTFRRAIAVYRKHYTDDHTRLARLLRYYADFQQSAIVH